MGSPSPNLRGGTPTSVQTAALDPKSSPASTEGKTGTSGATTARIGDRLQMAAADGGQLSITLEAADYLPTDIIGGSPYEYGPGGNVVLTFLIDAPPGSDVSFDIRSSEPPSLVSLLCAGEIVSTSEDYNHPAELNRLRVEAGESGYGVALLPLPNDCRDPAVILNGLLVHADVEHGRDDALLRWSLPDSAVKPPKLQSSGKVALVPFDLKTSKGDPGWMQGDVKLAFLIDGDSPGAVARVRVKKVELETSGPTYEATLKRGGYDVAVIDLPHDAFEAGWPPIPPDIPITASGLSGQEFYSVHFQYAQATTPLVVIVTFEDGRSQRIDLRTVPASMPQVDLSTYEPVPDNSIPFTWASQGHLSLSLVGQCQQRSVFLSSYFGMRTLVKNTDQYQQQLGWGRFAPALIYFADGRLRPIDGDMTLESNVFAHYRHYAFSVGPGVTADGYLELYERFGNGFDDHPILLFVWDDHAGAFHGYRLNCTR